MLPQRVTVCEVGPRDGLQNEKKFIDTDDKVNIINKLSEAGLTRIQITSFVNPKVIPQMSDCSEVSRQIKKYPDTVYAALVLNLTGVKRAIEAQIEEVHMTLTASDTFNQKNSRMTTDESLANFRSVAEEAHKAGVKMWGVMGTAFGCPFEGEIPDQRVLAIAGELISMGVTAVNFADTTGIANPRQVYELSSRFKDRWPEMPLVLHFHNTRGSGLANVLGGLKAGVTMFESCVGGVGGCPFAPRAVGNISTEDLAHMLWGMGIETGINLGKLLAISLEVEKVLGYELPGQIMKAGPVPFRINYPVEI